MNEPKHTEFVVRVYRRSFDILSPDKKFILTGNTCFTSSWAPFIEDVEDGYSGFIGDTEELDAFLHNAPEPPVFVAALNKHVLIDFRSSWSNGSGWLVSDIYGKSILRRQPNPHWSKPTKIDRSDLFATREEAIAAASTTPETHTHALRQVLHPDPA